jgi:hypothetical protein
MNAKNGLVAFVPPEMLEAKKKEITALVKDSDSETLHTTFTKMRGFFALFEEAVKEAFVSRAKEAKKTEEYVETSVGRITLNTRHNYTYDEDKVRAFLKRHRISEDRLYDSSFTIEAKDPKILAKLIDQGVISKKMGKIRAADYEELARQFPELLEFVTDNPTEYVKGL